MDSGLEVAIRRRSMDLPATRLWAAKVPENEFSTMFLLFKIAGLRLLFWSRRALPGGSFSLTHPAAQANNGGATILLTAANIYSTPNLYMTGDLNVVMPGRQVEITVEVAVPNGTPLGAYTTNYGVKSSL